MDVQKINQKKGQTCVANHMGKKEDTNGEKKYNLTSSSTYPQVLFPPPQKQCQDDSSSHSVINQYDEFDSISKQLYILYTNLVSKEQH